MDDRERIADCIAFHVWGCEVLCTEHRETAIRTADAVLAALGNRLLPELPEGWRLYGISTIHDVRKTLYFATIWNPNNDGPKYQNGTDLTIADAIRDAVGEVEG